MPIDASASTASEPLVRMTPKEIVCEIDSRPPYQRDEAEKHYLGMRIRVDGRLRYLSKQDSDHVRVIVAPRDSDWPTVRLEVDVNDYPELKVMPEGTALTVEGKISGFSFGDVDLDDGQICR